MSSLVNGQISAGFNVTLSAGRTVGIASDIISQSYKAAFGNGVGAEQANMSFSEKRTLAQSAWYDYDLNGVLQNGLGESIGFTRIVALCFVNLGTKSTLIIGGAPVNPFDSIFTGAAHQLIIRPSGDNQPSFQVLCGADLTAYVVANGSKDILRVTHGGEDVDDIDFEIALLGSQP